MVLSIATARGAAAPPTAGVSSAATRAATVATSTSPTTRFLRTVMFPPRERRHPPTSAAADHCTDRAKRERAPNALPVHDDGPGACAPGPSLGLDHRVRSAGHFG